MNCDCGRDDILELGDGTHLCLVCRCELENFDGKFCGAWFYRGQCVEASEQYAADEQKNEEYLDDFTPSHGTAPIVSFSQYERPKQYFSRRWEKERENAS